jgi:glycosyltransferase involved in cell wall biosynthesis
MVLEYNLFFLWYRMKILFLNYEYPPLGGGAANATAYLMKEFSVMPDVEMSVVTSSFDEDFHTETIGNGITLYRLPIGKNAQNIHFQSAKDLLMYTAKAYFFSRKLLKQEKFDLVQAFFTVPCGAIAWKLSREFSVPYVVSLRGSDVPGYSDRFQFLYPFLRPIVRMVWRGASAVVSNSRGLKELALQTNNEQSIAVIPNGVDVKHFVPQEKSLVANEGVIHLTLGASRLTDRKGIVYLIEALDILRDTFRFSLVIIGDGNAKERLEQLVKDRDLSESISFVGRIPREETLPYYQTADIFVLPSLNEGMSNAMLEALACGLPMITTRTGGADELVKEGENGLFIEQANAQDVARALTVLCEDTELRQQMGKKSRALAETMSWQSVATQYSVLYQSIVEGKI